MKGLFYLSAFITFFSCKENLTYTKESTSGDETTMLVKSPDNYSETLPALKSIEDIRKECSYITSKLERGSMDSSSFNYNCNDEKSGKLTYISEKGQLRLIKHAYTDNEEIKCSSLEPILEDFELLFKLRNQKKDLICLEK